MPTVVGVKLRFAGKVLWFDPAGSAPEEGQNVIVSTERGQEFGEIVMTPREVDPAEVPAELKPVLRIADENDVKIGEVIVVNRALTTTEQDNLHIYLSAKWGTPA